MKMRAGVKASLFAEDPSLGGLHEISLKWTQNSKMLWIYLVLGQASRSLA